MEPESDPFSECFYPSPEGHDASPEDPEGDPEGFHVCGVNKDVPHDLHVCAAPRCSSSPWADWL